MLTASNLPTDDQNYFEQYMSNQPDTRGHNGMGIREFVTQNIKARAEFQLCIINGERKDTCPIANLSNDGTVLYVHVSDIATPIGKIQLLYWYFEKFRPDMAFAPMIYIDGTKIKANEETEPQIEHMKESNHSMRLSKIFLKLLEDGIDNEVD